MSKILYVEDGLRTSDILTHFSKYLSEEEKKKLEKREIKRKKDIKEMLEKNLFINVEYNFIDAVNRIENHFDEFSFFIFDYNLSDIGSYDITKLKKTIDIEFQKGNEGKYLFFLLFDKYLKYSNPRFLLENFYFLTAFSTESLQIREQLKNFLMFFPTDHIIQKITKQEDNFIVDKINKFPELVIKSEHREVFEVFSKGYLDTSFEKDLLSVLKVINLQDLSKIKGSVSLLRNIFEEILRKVIEVKKIRKEMPKEFYESGNPDISKILTFLNGTPTYDNNWNPTTTEYFSNSHYLLSHYGLWKVSSEIGHGGKSGKRTIKYIPTRYSLLILVNIMMDFLIWFGDFMDNQII